MEMETFLKKYIDFNRIHSFYVTNDRNPSDFYESLLLLVDTPLDAHDITDRCVSSHHFKDFLLNRSSEWNSNLPSTSDTARIFSINLILEVLNETSPFRDRFVLEDVICLTALLFANKQPQQMELVFDILFSFGAVGDKQGNIEVTELQSILCRLFNLIDKLFHFSPVTQFLHTYLNSSQKKSDEKFVQSLAGDIVKIFQDYREIKSAIVDYFSAFEFTSFCNHLYLNPQLFLHHPSLLILPCITMTSLHFKEHNVRLQSPQSTTQSNNSLSSRLQNQNPTSNGRHNVHSRATDNGKHNVRPRSNGKKSPVIVDKRLLEKHWRGPGSTHLLPTQRISFAKEEGWKAVLDSPEFMQKMAQAYDTPKSHTKPKLKSKTKSKKPSPRSNSRSPRSPPIEISNSANMINKALNKRSPIPESNHHNMNTIERQEELRYQSHIEGEHARENRYRELYREKYGAFDVNREIIMWQKEQEERIAKSLPQKDYLLALESPNLVNQALMKRTPTSESNYQTSSTSYPSSSTNYPSTSTNYQSFSSTPSTAQDAMSPSNDEIFAHQQSQSLEEETQNGNGNGNVTLASKYEHLLSEHHKEVSMLRHKLEMERIAYHEEKERREEMENLSLFLKEKVAAQEKEIERLRDVMYNLPTT